MRIIAGTYRSRTLEAPSGLTTRPTSDRLRETLFNVLASHIDGSAFLDLYAGSGGVGIEAKSRGATRVTFVERAPAALKVLRANLTRLGLTRGFCIAPRGVGSFLRKLEGQVAFDLVFLDPPYDADAEYAGTLGSLGSMASSLLASGAIVIAEHRRQEKLQDRYGSLSRTRLLEQGDAALSFYAVDRKGAEEMDGKG